MKKIFLILLIFISLTSFAQLQVKDGSFRKIDELVVDEDDDVLALVNISIEKIKGSQKSKFEFFDAQMEMVEQKVGKKNIQILLPPETQSMSVYHPDYGDLEYVFPEKL